VTKLENYLRKIEGEYKELTAGVFWKEYIEAIMDLRKKASHNCENYDEVKEDQGKIKAYDKVLGLPDKILALVIEKDKKRATNR